MLPWVSERERDFSLVFTSAISVVISPLPNTYLPSTCCMLSWRKSFAYFLNPLTITIYDGLMHFKKLKLSYCLLHYYIRLFIFIKNTNYKIMNTSKLDLYEFTFTAITTSQHPVFFSHIHVIFTCKLIHIPPFHL